MIYILETKLYDNKFIFFALKNIYGIGSSKSLGICKRLGFAKNLKVKNLTEDQIKRLLKVVDESNLLITSDLKKFKNLILKSLVSIKSYRGLRRIKGLPVRGQRTHTNARTARKIKL
jgi:small subunit ribosomal protein S13